MSTAKPAAADSKSASANLPARRCFPPISIWLTLAVCAALVFGLWRFSEVERAIKNIGTLIVGFVGLMTLFVWFVWRSGYPRALRLGTLVAALVAVGAAAATLRVEHVNGAMEPEFRWRWQPKADRLLPKATATAATPSDDLPTAPSDFPQFLGRARDGVVEGVDLARDWQKTPPEQIWQRQIGAGWSAFAIVGGLAFTMEQRGEDELVSCYRVDNGELVWADSYAARHEEVLGGVGPRATPSVVDGKVYALGATGVLRCLDARSGERLWTKDLNQLFNTGGHEADMGEIAWGRSASPLVVDDLVIVPAGGPAGGPYVSLVAFDRLSGKEVWRGGERQIGYASASQATLDGVPQILIVNESTVTGHDPATGAELWSIEWPGSSNRAANNSQAVALDDHRVFVSKGYGGGAMVFDVRHGESGWTTKTEWKVPRVLQTKFTNVVIDKSQAYGLSDGILECVDLQTGQRTWKKGRYGHGQILRVNDLLLVLSETGELALVELNPEKFVELGKVQALEGKTWNNLALSGDRLLIRNAEEAKCYRLTLVEGE